jgi:hypothetical protein
MNALLNIGSCDVWTLKLESFKDLESLIRVVKEARSLLEIGTDWITDEVRLELPHRLEEEIVEDLLQVVKLCRSKTVVFNIVPLELAPSIKLLKDICVTDSRAHEFETSLFTLKSCGLDPNAKLRFEGLHLNSKLPLLSAWCIKDLFELKRVTVSLYFTLTR